MSKKSIIIALVLLALSIIGMRIQTRNGAGARGFSAPGMRGGGIRTAGRFRGGMESRSFRPTQRVGLGQRRGFSVRPAYGLGVQQTRFVSPRQGYGLSTRRPSTLQPGMVRPFAGRTRPALGSRVRPGALRPGGVRRVGIRPVLGNKIGMRSGFNRFGLSKPRYNRFAGRALVSKKFGNQWQWRRGFHNRNAFANYRFRSAPYWWNWNSWGPWWLPMWWYPWFDYYDPTIDITVAPQEPADYQNLVLQTEPTLKDYYSVRNATNDYIFVVPLQDGTGTIIAPNETKRVTRDEDYTLRVETATGDSTEIQTDTQNLVISAENGTIQIVQG